MYMVVHRSLPRAWKNVAVHGSFHSSRGDRFLQSGASEAADGCLYVMGDSLCDVAVERKTIGNLFGDSGSGSQMRRVLRNDLHQIVAQHLPQLPPTSTVTEQIPNRFPLHCHV